MIPAHPILHWLAGYTPLHLISLVSSLVAVLALAVRFAVSQDKPDQPPFWVTVIGLLGFSLMFVSSLLRTHVRWDGLATGSILAGAALMMAFSLAMMRHNRDVAMMRHNRDVKRTGRLRRRAVPAASVWPPPPTPPGG